MEAAEEQGLPALQGRQGTAAVAMVKALQPGRFEVRAIEAEVVEGIGNRPTQLPERPVEGLPVRSPSSQRASRAALSLATSSGRSSSSGQTRLVARQGSAPPGSSPSRWLTIWRRWLPGKGKRRLAAMPPSSTASCSPSQRLVGQVLTTTCTVSQGPGGSRSSCWASTLARNSARLLRKTVSNGLRSEAAHAGRRWDRKRPVRCVRPVRCRARSSWRRFQGNRR